MCRYSPLVIISVLLSGPFHDIEKIITGKGRSDTERVGDFLQIMLPSYGLYKTYKIDDKDGRRQLWKSLLSTFVVTYALKYGIDKTRPNGDCCESFPSGHTQAAFTVAILFLIYFQRYHLIIIGVAMLMGLSRIFMSMHFPSDLIFGAYIGSLIPIVIYKFHFKFKFDKIKKTRSINFFTFCKLLYWRMFI